MHTTQLLFLASTTFPLPPINKLLTPESDRRLEDYLNNIRRNNNSTQSTATHTPEQQFQQDYEAIFNQAIEQGKELNQLGNIPPSNRTESQKQRVIELRKNQPYRLKQS